MSTETTDGEFKRGAPGLTSNPGNPRPKPKQGPPRISKRGSTHGSSSPLLTPGETPGDPNPTRTKGAPSPKKIWPEN